MEQTRLLKLLEKKTFVDRVSYAIVGQPRISVAAVNYEVWEHNNDSNEYLEFIKVTYDGGAFAIRTVNATSQPYIFKEIAALIDGGYYAEVKTYIEMVESGEFTQVI